ncbi:PREDICTED: dual specificity protein phosphatase 12 isoform X2 [Corvus brachyrhynchos]|uniref:dual specificity protein phosphatase 12 isoform X2 n=1 Tax=Corvus brachyrhynchos TaxID=85066 RepID=UPI0008164AC4|nr:PREDICTED: dual specificity protein phosphatase 12 isoform X2 [Corvus brachyrhynchos]
MVLTPLQNLKTCPEKSLQLILPLYVKLRTQRFSTDAGNAEGIGPTAFAHKRITDSARLSGNGQEKCTSYFIEPVQWMEPALLGVMEGQLLCPKCTSKLGSFSWRGDQCSCGRWVTPAFQIHKSRVDEVRTLPVGNFQTAKT